MRSLVASVDVDRPVGPVYDQWSRIEDLPAIMPGLVDVQRLDDTTSRWDVLIGREHRSFTARIREQVPDQRLAWTTAAGTLHTGVVTFHRAGPGRTRVTVQLDWEPDGLFDTVGDRLGLVRRHIQRDLDAFRHHLERQEVPVAGHRETIGSTNGTRPGGPGREDSDMARSGASDDIDLREQDDGAEAHDDGRGRTAESPTDIPPKGWFDVLKRTWGERKSDNVQILAAGVAFYLFLSLVPTLIATISVYGLVSDPADVQRQLSDALAGLPAGAAQLVEEQLTSVAETSPTGLGISVAVSILAALWSASKGMQALIIALNMAYNEDETRGFVKLRGLAVLLTVGVIVAAVVGVGGMVAIAALAGNLGSAAETAVTIARWPVLGVMVMAGVAVLYRYAPDRDNAEWRWVSPGAVLAVIVLLVASIGFSFYVNNFGSFGETYGALAGVVILLLWLFIASFIVIMGAEMDSEAERQTFKDSTDGSKDPLGKRNARSADTVGASS